MIYDVIAPYYDDIMSHVDYNRWINLIEFVSESYSPVEKIKILEIGGGTGTLGSRLTKIGYEYYFSDISFRMSLQAQKKDLQPFCADCRCLPVKKKFDMIIFLYDGINYLQSLDEYKKVFLSVSSCLNKGGLFLFDITTETNSRKHFTDLIDYQEYSRVSVVRHSRFNKSRLLQTNDFVIFCPVSGNDNLYEKKTERHIQKIFSPEEIKGSIPSDVFRCIGIFDGFSPKKYSAHSERIHFLLQKIN